MFLDKLFFAILVTCNLVNANVSNNVRSRSFGDRSILTESTISFSEPHIDSKFAPYYFSNLRSDHFGFNGFNSCGYVALGMMLSFWDTYWDDNLINDYWDNPVECSRDYIQLRTQDSPGIRSESDTSIFDDPDEIATNVALYSGTYFQCFLIYYALNGLHYDIDTDGLLMTGLEIYNLLNSYLFSFKNYNANEAATTYDFINVRSKAINYVRGGTPVLLGLSKTGSSIGHEVIAYDYDEINDKLYCHFGWDGDSYRHMAVEDSEYNIYTDCIAMNLYTNHSHSNNYYFQDLDENTYYCPCSTAFPHEVEIDGTYSLDLIPTFKWFTLVNERWFSGQGLAHTFSFLDMNLQEIVCVTDINTDHYQPTMAEYNLALALHPNFYYVLIAMQSSQYCSYDDYFYRKTFYEPTFYENKIQIKPYEWGFEPRYYFENEGIRTTQLNKNNLTLSTSRLRCGYIENSYVVLSPRRENAGVAYLEITSNFPIYSFLYSISWWSSYESFNGVLNLDVKYSINGNWTTLYDIRQSCDINIRPMYPSRYSHSFSNGVYGIRFYATSSALGDRNKGRACIDDLVLSISSLANDNIYYSYNYSKTSSLN